MELGIGAKDAITGFKGTLTARIEYITGRIQYEVTPQVGSDGSSQKAEWVDESRLEKTAENKTQLGF